jgi:cyanophycin synthetase
MAEGARCRQVVTVLNEIDAVNHVMARSNPGDLVVMCVDKHAQVVAELENRTQSAQAGSHSSEIVGDPDLDPTVLARDAEVQGQEADVEAVAAEHEAAEEAESSQPAPA